MSDAAPEPPRGRQTTFEIITVPAGEVPRASWGLRILVALVMILLAASTVALAGWRPPRVDEHIVWEQIAPPETVPIRPWRWLVIHHSATRSGDPQSFDNVHIHDHGWDGIGYHFVMGNGSPMPLGRIEATFRWRNQTHGAHAGIELYNQAGIGICLVGDFERSQPDEFQERRLVELCCILLDRIPTLSIARIIGHKDIPGKNTQCPGRHLDVERIRYLVREEMVKRGMMVR